jgi:hypothetical protein
MAVDTEAAIARKEGRRGNKRRRRRVVAAVGVRLIVVVMSRNMGESLVGFVNLGLFFIVWRRATMKAAEIGRQISEI